MHFHHLNEIEAVLFGKAENCSTRSVLAAFRLETKIEKQLLLRYGITFSVMCVTISKRWTITAVADKSLYRCILFLNEFRTVSEITEKIFYDFVSSKPSLGRFRLIRIET